MPTWDDLTGRFETADIVLWAAGLGALAVFLLPILVSISGLLLVRYVAVEDPIAGRPDGSDPERAERVDELTELGFQPHGFVHEECWLWLHHFYKCHTLRYLVGEGGTTFATVYRLGFGGFIRVVLDTVTEAGVLIQTAMPGAGIPADEADFQRAELPRQPVADLLAAHRRRVEEYARQHGDRPTRATLAERTAIDERANIRQLRQIKPGFTLLFPAVGWGLPFLASMLLIGLVADVEGPRRVGVSLLLAAASYVTFTGWLLPALLRWGEGLEDPPPVGD
jgi:hypothetical protein